MTDLKVNVEIFAVDQNKLPKLTVYTPEIRGGDRSTVGGKLSYRLRRKFPGHWVWTSGRIVTDQPRSEDEIKELINLLWKEDSKTYQSLIKLRLEQNDHLPPQVYTDFVARGLLEDLRPAMQQALQADARSIDKARIERVYDVRGWVVDGEPAVSLSISSRMIYKDDLRTYAATLNDPDELVGLWVADKTSTLKGEIKAISGTLAENRERLLAITQREEMQQIIQKGDDAEPVVQVYAGGAHPYDYAASALRIVLRTADLKRFGISGQKALKLMRLEPGVRVEMLKKISKLAQDSGLIQTGFISSQSPKLFRIPNDLLNPVRLKLGGGQVVTYNERRLLYDLQSYGIYRRAQAFQNNAPIRVGLLNGIGNTPYQQFLDTVQRDLGALKFSMQIVGTVQVNPGQRADLEHAVQALMKNDIHLLLALLPDERDEDDDQWGAYHHLKFQTVGQGLPSQVVYRSTLDKQYAVANIIMGMLGKTGNIPFILADNLPFADLVVGIDIARERRERLGGSINATAIARIYFGDGQFVRYVIHDAPLEGETIPTRVLQTLFPAPEFKDKRVVIQRDGYFRGDEKNALKEWGKQIGAQFLLLELIKSGAPRLYAWQQQGQGSAATLVAQQAPKGSAFKISSTEALLVSSLPPFREATPLPLHLRAEPPFTIDQAIDSVLALTYLHYGSLRPPRLPVTIHYSDRIAYMALRGIKPKNLEGDVPFWL